MPEIQQLLRALASLEDSWKEERLVCSQLSHDLRGYLAGIVHSLRESPHSMSHDLLLERLQKSLDMTDSLLSQRWTGGSSIHAPGIMDLDHEFEHLKNWYLARFENSGIEFQFMLDVPELRVFGDSSDLQRVVGNLMQNAEWYGCNQSAGQSITLFVLACPQEQDVWVRIRVSDHGSGFQPGEFESLLNPGLQGEVNRDQGHGLGLSAVLRIAEIHEGTMIAGIQPGAGASIQVSLRYPMAEYSRAADNSETPKIPLSSACILEDDSVQASMLYGMLSRRQIESIVVRSMGQLMTTVRNWSPELFLLDYGCIQQEDGIMDLARLRVQFPEARILLMSAGEIPRNLREDGLVDCIMSKPISLDMLALGSLCRQTQGSLRTEAASAYQDVLNQCDGDHEFTAELLRGFRRDTSARLKSLRCSTTVGPEIRTQIHAMTGACMTLGLHGLASRLQTLCRDCEAGTVDFQQQFELSKIGEDLEQILVELDPDRFEE